MLWNKTKKKKKIKYGPYLQGTYCLPEKNKTYMKSYLMMKAVFENTSFVNRNAIGVQRKE